MVAAHSQFNPVFSEVLFLIFCFVWIFGEHLFFKIVKENINMKQQKSQKSLSTPNAEC